jgi:GNAT superfamily N-acetyltransferase
VTGLKSKPLDVSTWPDFAALAERHNGVWGGCWCMGFHAEGLDRDSAAANRAAKERHVREGRAHAALVFDESTCVGWCQFGPADELTRIKRKREYLQAVLTPPDWRITCFLVDRTRRRSGVADAALGGALREIARLGGGRVESYPEDVTGRKTSGSFLHNGTLAMFERHGFERDRRLGKHHWVVAKDVAGEN